MLFHTFEFALFFLPLTLATYYSVSGNTQLRQWTLLLASVIFYCWWDVRFLPLLVGQVTLTWLLAGHWRLTGSKAPIVIGIALNLFSIGTWKYLDFIVDTTNILLGTELPRNNLILPIGISFFSFQLISYLMDLERGEAPIYPFRPFALFVMVFPHLIAGPIVRHNELIPQFESNPSRVGLFARMVCGIGLFSLGLLKKVFVADPIALVSDPLFAKSADQALSFGESWTAALSFSFQLFLDFSAYTEMAIGIALMFGLVLPENFDRPYMSTNLREFWRRWHISLSKFIRDYLYIPLGGSRKSFFRYILAALGSMGICGLWHGAAWTFVAWGLWHGLGLIVCRWWQSSCFRLPALVGWGVTSLFVILGWVLFRAHSFPQAFSIASSMFGSQGLTGSLTGVPYMFAGLVFATVIPSAHRLQPLLERHWINTLLVSIGVAIAAFVHAGRTGNVNFIYFQF